ncbi:hypothetical protein CXQ85_004874 [Candidozyma haemuli]|uniref:Centrosomin N-terminal motif 1 domain-containing protein n=1 Tax=Candidozyma haemuli TaxID=45357 RepID=A0A2V1AWN5_9ASCO|nr:hypothetical protein CXQ85_004874 [[Candida] haemuloni]PVH22204.1 hypothetical protein CXQ85_004874 [[Candida] haemuloni]
MAINSDKISNSQIDTTFENTDDTETHHSMQSQTIGVSSLNTAKNPRSGGFLDGFFKQKDKILGDGAGSAQEITARLEALQQENYNLKFEVATLTKYMRKAPEEQRQMVYENMELKQKLARAMEDLEKQPAAAVASSGSPERAMAAMKSSYKEALGEKDDIIGDLKAQVAQLQSEVSGKSKVPGELYERLESLQNDNQSLRRQLTDSASRRDFSHNELQEENNELKAQVHQLQLQQSKVPSDANEQIGSLEGECKTLQRKLREAVDDLRSVEGQKEALESKQKAVKSETQALEQRIDSLVHEKKTLQDEKDSLDALVRQIRSQAPGKEKQIDELHAQMSKLNASTSRRDAQLKEATAEARDLRTRLRSLEDDILEKQHEVDRLSRKNTHLEKELASNNSLDRYRPLEDTNKASQVFEEQIDELHKNSQRLKAEKRDLEDIIAELEDKLARGSHSKNDQQHVIDELHERVDFYEKEYSSLVDEMERNSIKYDSLKEDLDAKELQLEHLKAELRTAQRESQRTDTRYYELEKKRDEEKVYRLERQIDSLSSHNRQLEREMEDAKRASDLIAKEKDRLVSEVHDMESRIRDNKLSQSKLETTVRDKEEVIEALESRLRTVSRDYRGKSYVEESYGAKAELNYELQSLQREKERSERELERLQKELNDQQRYYENKLDVLKERARVESVPDDSAMVALLESQLEEAKREIKALEVKQNEARKNDVSAALDDYRDRIAELESRVTSSQKDKSKLKEVIDTMETEMKILASEKTSLEVRARNLDSELTKTTRHCNRLARKINDIDSVEYKNSNKNAEDILRAKKTNAQLQAHIDSLNSKLAQASISNPFSAAPKTPNRRSSTEQRLQQNELLYYKAKLFEIQNKAKDLAQVHSMVMSSVRNADAEFRNELAKTALLGVYPEVEQRQAKKPTFRVVAQFVLAAVKMKRRQERAEARKQQLLQLREEIEKDRITLLAE